jgi:hypothetical protein
MIALRSLLLTLLVAMPSPLHAQVDWSPEWSPNETANDVVTYVHASGNAYIVDWADIVAQDTDLNAMIRRLSTDIDNCPDLVAAAASKIASEDKINEVRVKGAGINCSIFAGRHNGRTSVIYTVEATDPNYGARELAISLIETKLGLGFDKTKATKIALSTQAKAPSDLAGIWRADWVESRNPGLGGMTFVALNETLIFTPGGYFFHGLPGSGVLDDTTAKQMVAQQSPSVGTYVVRSNDVILTAGNGLMQTIDMTHDGIDTIITYFGHALKKKIALPDGHALEGHFFRDHNAAPAQTGQISDYFFFANGRFSALDGTPTEANQSAALNGRYAIKASMLYLYFDDGKQIIQPVFREKADGPINFDGEIWLLAGGQADTGV